MDPGILIRPDVVRPGATVVVQLRVGKEGRGDPRVMPVRPVVVDRNDGPRASFEDEKLLGILITHEVVAALEVELLMAPHEVLGPAAGKDLGGEYGPALIHVVLEQIVVKELRTAIDRHGHGVSQRRAPVV